MASRFSIEAVVSMIDRVSNPMGQASAAVAGFSSNAQKHFRKAEKASMGFGGVVKGIIGANIIQSALHKVKDGFMGIVNEAAKM